MENGINQFWSAVKRICFPPVCLDCSTKLPNGTGQGGTLFCNSCYYEIKLLTGPLCSKCGKAFPVSVGTNHLCSTCLTYNWHFSSAKAVGIYKGPLAKAVQSFKYRGKTVCLTSFKSLKDKVTLPNANDFDLIIPVPLHKKKLKERGFNQALVLSRILYPEEIKKINANILIRIRWTEPQTGLSGSARRRNLRNSFKVISSKIKGKNILLVDDVFTTGTTANECARTLRKAGAYDVQVITLARVNQ